MISLHPVSHPSPLLSPSQLSPQPTQPSSRCQSKSGKNLGLRITFIFLLLLPSRVLYRVNLSLRNIMHYVYVLVLSWLIKMRETHRNLWWIIQPWWRGPGVWQSLYKILTVLQIFGILRSLMIARDGLKTRLTARIITDLRTLMPNSIIQILTGDCIASTEYY